MRGTYNGKSKRGTFENGIGAFVEKGGTYKISKGAFMTEGKGLLWGGEGALIEKKNST